MIALFAATIIAAAAAATPDPVAPIRRQMLAAHDTIVASFKQINDRSGLAVALEERIDVDTPGVEFASKPAWMSDTDFLDYDTVLAKMDATIVEQLATGDYHPLGSIRGSDDTAFKSPVDGTMQPLGVYVPASYDPKKATSLVVFLHGRTCSEADVIGLPWVREAADSTGTIVIAPYARGDSQYVDPASADVYEALVEAKRAFNIDPKKIYLAGHSMGGYGVFIVGPKHPDYWAAIMATSGGMTTQTQDTALRALQHVPIYLVIGSQDPIVPPGYMKTNEHLLIASGIETHYYEDPNGLHPIGTYAATYDRAWRDMLSHSLSHPAPQDSVEFPAAGVQPMSGRNP